jgi:hypothetical protein
LWHWFHGNKLVDVPYGSGAIHILITYPFNVTAYLIYTTLTSQVEEA